MKDWSIPALLVALLILVGTSHVMLVTNSGVMADSSAETASEQKRLATAHEGVLEVERETARSTTFSTEWSGSGFTHRASTPVHTSTLGEDLQTNRAVVMAAVEVWKP